MDQIDNGNTEALEQEDRNADTCSTGRSSIKPTSLSLENKVLIADFTSQGSSKQAGKGRERRGSGPPLGLMRDSLVQPFRPEELGISKSSLKCLTRRGRLQDSRKGCWDLWSTTFKPTMEDGNKLTETKRGVRNSSLN